MVAVGVVVVMATSNVMVWSVAGERVRELRGVVNVQANQIQVIRDKCEVRVDGSASCPPGVFRTFKEGK